LVVLIMLAILAVPAAIMLVAMALAVGGVYS
jgi:hypothetical protein